MNRGSLHGFYAQEDEDVGLAQNKPFPRSSGGYT